MSAPERAGSRQLSAAAFVALLSPCVRRYPRLLAAQAGAAAPLVPLLAAVPVGAGLLLAYLGARRVRCGSLGGLYRFAFGARGGRAAQLVYGLWLVCYAGFLLRAGAERFITTVYPGAGPGLFVWSMAALCLPAALGAWRAIPRTASLLLPLLAAVPAAALLLAAKDMDFSLLARVGGAEVRGALRAAPELANTLGAALFLLTQADRNAPLRLRDFALRTGALLALLAAVAAGCVAMFGADLTARLEYPFFMLVRDVSVLGALERVEPVVAGLWVFSDFVLVSALLAAAGRCLREGLGARGGARRPTALCAAAAGALGLWAVPGLAAFEALNLRWVPLGSALFGVGLPAAALVIAAMRRGRRRGWRSAIP